MPTAQLEALVLSLMEAEAAEAAAKEAPREPAGGAPDDEGRDAIDEAIDEWIDNFDTQPTKCVTPRTSTIDQLIAALKHPEVAHHPPRHRQRRRDPRR